MDRLFAQIGPQSLLAGVRLVIASTVVLLTGLAIVRALRGFHPAVRSSVCRLTLVAAVVAAALAVGLPTGMIHTWSIPVSVSPRPRLALAGGEFVPATGRQPLQPIRSSAAAAASAPAPASTGASVAGRTGLAAAGIWLAGCLWIGLQLFVSMRWVRRLQREACLIAEPEINSDLRRLATLAGVRPPELRVHPDAGVPFLSLAPRPVVMLPPALLEPGERGSLTVVLAHEVAHIRRNDCEWKLLSHFARSLLWFQPLIWMLARELAEASEAACDSDAAAVCGSPRLYAETLLHLARTLSGANPGLASVGALPFRSSLGRRVQTLLHFEHHRSKPMSLPFRFGSAAAFTLVVAAAAALTPSRATRGNGVPLAEAAKQPGASGSRLIIELTDSANPPARGAERASGLIHDSDLQRLVEELRTSGATSISVNERRVEGPTRIRAHGAAIDLDGVPLTPPFVVVAVGNATRMEAALAGSGGVIASLRRTDPRMARVARAAGVSSPTVLQSVQPKRELVLEGTARVIRKPQDQAAAKKSRASGDSRPATKREVEELIRETRATRKAYEQALIQLKAERQARLLAQRDLAQALVKAGLVKSAEEKRAERAGRAEDLESEIAAARAQLDAAEAMLARDRELFKAGSLSLAELEQADSRVMTEQAQLKMLENRLARVKGMK